jgi:hypothetical protein
MMIGDLNYGLLCPITNNRDKCLIKYDNYMMIGDLNYDLLCSITNTRDNCLNYLGRHLSRVLVIEHSKSEFRSLIIM